MNETMRNFGYPATLIKEYAHWCVLLRPAQVTLGALVLACKDPGRRFGEISAAAFTEQALVIGDIERVLEAFVAFEKMNYMMLMMVDPDVHYHVLPRYGEVRTFEGTEFVDAGWPALPRLDAPTPTTPAQNEALVSRLQALW
jgi:diadenosine tetraphosphate (Ap4A) HIT family hydrolase